jgi:DNA modification methylase
MIAVGTVLVGDMREVLSTWPESCVDAVVTDAPYELGFMGKAWDRSGVAFDPATWAHCLRVLKPGGHLTNFGHPRTEHRIVCAIEDAGFEIRDKLSWMYGEGFPKSRSALKPAYEPIVLARKPLVGTLEDNVLAYGTGGINVDACRIGTSKRVPGSMPKAHAGFEGKSFASADRTGREGPGQDPNVGRWPANMIMDECAAALLDEQTGTLHGRKNQGASRAGPSHPHTRGAMDGNECGEESNYDEGGGASRFFYTAKASREERERGLVGPNGKRLNLHPTVKPISLMRWLVRLVTPSGGIVLDPFAGSGSTLCAAAAEGFRWVGIELDAAHAEVARFRVLASLEATGTATATDAEVAQGQRAVQLGLLGLTDKGSET